MFDLLTSISVWHIAKICLCRSVHEINIACCWDIKQSRKTKISTTGKMVDKSMGKFVM